MVSFVLHQDFGGGKLKTILDKMLNWVYYKRKNVCTQYNITTFHNQKMRDCVWCIKLQSYVPVYTPSIYHHYSRISNLYTEVEWYIQMRRESKKLITIDPHNPCRFIKTIKLKARFHDFSIEIGWIWKGKKRTVCQDIKLCVLCCTIQPTYISICVNVQCTHRT